MSSAMDEVLQILRGTGPEYGPGYSNHGPMASEAMIKLGFADEAPTWAMKYRKRLKEPPTHTDIRISKTDWKEYLGNHSNVSDWALLFQIELKERPFQQVLDQWAMHLAPGLMAGSTHGLIRVGHAVRSLESGIEQGRLDELAEGLAYWAAFYQSLPSDVQENVQSHPADQAIHQVPVLSAQELAQHHFSLIRESTTLLDRLQSFPQVLNLIDTTGDISQVISGITSTFAAVYLANAPDIGRCITFIHTVTAPSAVRNMVPHLSDSTSRVLLKYVWQAASALYAVYGQAGEGKSCLSFDGDWDKIIDRAISTHDEHAIKFTEVCQKEYKIQPDPVFVAAADHATAMIAHIPVEPILARC